MGESRGSIAFFATYRPPVPLDIFSVPIPPSTIRDEVHLTDGVSYNYNCRPIPKDALKSLLKRPKLAAEGGATDADVDSGRVSGLLFVSERDSGLETLQVALRFKDGGKAYKVFSLADVFAAADFSAVRLEDSGCSGGGYKVGSRTVDHSLIYVSTKEPVQERRSPWTVVYKTNLRTGKTECLTPKGQFDLSPAVSPSGKKVAMATFRPEGWEGEIEDLQTDIFVMNVERPPMRKRLIKNGGWPSWASEDVIFFHRKVGETWGVFRHDARTNETVRVTGGLRRSDAGGHQRDQGGGGDHPAEVQVQRRPRGGAVPPHRDLRHGGRARAAAGAGDPEDEAQGGPLQPLRPGRRRPRRVPPRQERPAEARRRRAPELPQDGVAGEGRGAVPGVRRVPDHLQGRVEAGVRGQRVQGGVGGRQPGPARGVRDQGPRQHLLADVEPEPRQRHPVRVHGPLLQRRQAAGDLRHPQRVQRRAAAPAAHQGQVQQRVPVEQPGREQVRVPVHQGRRRQEAQEPVHRGGRGGRRVQRRHGDAADQRGVDGHPLPVVSERGLDRLLVDAEQA